MPVEKAIPFVNQKRIQQFSKNPKNVMKSQYNDEDDYDFYYQDRDPSPKQNVSYAQNNQGGPSIPQHQRNTQKKSIDLDRPLDQVQYVTHSSRQKAPSQSSSANETFSLNFSIFYPTEIGESIAVVGSINELGNWKEYKHHLKWTEGHNWVSETPLVTNTPRFFYKYILMQDRASQKGWESGMDRIAELTILPSQTQKSNANDKGMKHVQIIDKWQKYQVRFSVFDPWGKNNDQLWLQSSSGSFGKIKMELQRKPESWLKSKYDTQVNVWKTPFMEQSNEGGDAKGQVSNILNSEYFYTKSNGTIEERQPLRVIQVDNPHTYKGHLGLGVDSTWKIQDKVQIVNGVVEKSDGTFLQGFFFNEVGEKRNPFNIILGSYPLYEVDVQAIAQKSRSTAVLNVQSDYEMGQRGIDEKTIMNFYKKQGINTYLRIPVSDDNEAQYSKDMFEVQKVLADWVLNKNHRVYLHDTSGISRCPSIATVYVCLNITSNNWKHPDEVRKLIESQHAPCKVNMSAVTRCINEHLWYREEILDRKRKLDHDQQMIITLAEQEKQRLERIRQQQRQNLLRQREEYLRKEYDHSKERIQMQEKELLKRLQKEENERQRLIVYHNQAEEKLQLQLKRVDDEEIERIRLLSEQKVENSLYEHYIVGEIDYNGINDNVIDEQCEVLFMNGTPIKFTARKGEKVDMEVKKMIDEMNITIPIIWIKKSIYLVGNKTISLEKKGEYVTAHIGGGYRRFEDYISENHKKLERDLVIKMIQSKESLEWICESISNGQRIPTVQSMNTSKINESANTFNQSPKSVRKSQTFTKDSPTKLSVVKKEVQQSNANPSVNIMSSPRRSYTKNVKGTSPNRFSDKQTSIYGSKSPSLSPTRLGQSKSPTSKQKQQQKRDSVKNQQALEAYQQSRQQILNELQSNDVQRNEHVNNGNQIQKNLNRGQYVYVHDQY